MPNDTQDWTTGQMQALGSTGSAGAGTNTQTVTPLAAAVELLITMVDAAASISVLGTTTNHYSRFSSQAGQTQIVVPIAPVTDASYTVSIVSGSDTHMDITATTVPVSATNQFIQSQDGGIVALGKKLDAAATNTAGSWSLISVCKGILAAFLSVWDQANNWLQVKVMNTVTVSGTVTANQGAVGTAAWLTQIVDAVNNPAIVGNTAPLSTDRGLAVNLNIANTSRTIINGDSGTQTFLPIQQSPMFRGLNAIIANGGVIMGAPGVGKNYFVTGVMSGGAGAADTWTFPIAVASMMFQSGVGNGGTAPWSSSAPLITATNGAVTYNAINVNQNLRIALAFFIGNSP